MKKFTFILAIALCTGSLVFSQANRRYVAVQNTTLKSSAGFFSINLRTLSLGDAVTLISDSGKWSRVQFENSTGWVQSSNLTAKRVIPSSAVSVSSNEVALAGKGFSPAVELEYRKNGLDYSMVDYMEQITIPSDDLLRFITEGRLAKGDGSFFDTFFIVTDDEYTLLDTYYLGRAVAANITKSYKPYTGNPEMTKYLNSICQTLVINSFRPPVFNDYHVIILDSDEFNAFASSGGHIFITRKLIEAAASEDMLAAVIAHELAHIMLRHSIAAIKETRFSNEMSAIADYANKTAGKYSAASSQASSFRDSITKVVDTLMINGYSQSQEFEADNEAMVLLFKAGYDPSALIDLLKVLQAQGSKRGGFYSTHPSPGERIANAERSAYRNIFQYTSQYRASRFRNMKL